MLWSKYPKNPSFKNRETFLKNEYVHWLAVIFLTIYQQKILLDHIGKIWSPASFFHLLNMLSKELTTLVVGLMILWDWRGWEDNIQKKGWRAKLLLLWVVGTSYIFQYVWILRYVWSLQFFNWFLALNAWLIEWLALSLLKKYFYFH